MFFPKLSIVLLVVLVFSSSKSADYEREYYDGQDYTGFEDCEYEIDFQSFKKTQKLNLCDALKSPSPESQIQLDIHLNHTKEKLGLSASSLHTRNSSTKKSLISLTTSISGDFKHPISLLTIDHFQFISFSTLQSILLSLINTDFNLLSQNLRKTLSITKGGHKQSLSCSGTFYPKQDIKTLNIKPGYTEPITCFKQATHDRFFRLEEKLYLNPTHQKNFNLVDIHQDDQKKISRTVWYTCNNPAACIPGLQNKKFLDKTVNYVLKVLQKGRMEKKTSSG